MIVYVIKNPAERPNTRALTSPAPTGDPREEPMEEADYVAWRDAQPALAGSAGPVRSQTTATVIRRLSAQEWTKLHEARGLNPAVDRLVSLALASGSISEDSPDFPIAVHALDALGVIATERWTELLAP